MSEAVNATIIDLINFHGLSLPVIQYENIQYLPAKPLVDLAGIDWRTTKKQLINEESMLLYATKALKLPQIAGISGDIPTPLSYETLYIRLDRARLFLARINTTRMKAQGNQSAAKKLLELQIEWAQVLHDYETKGIAVKKNAPSVMQLSQLFRVRNHAQTAQEKEAITQLIHQQLTMLGGDIALFTDKQAELFS